MCPSDFFGLQIWQEVKGEYFYRQSLLYHFTQGYDFTKAFISSFWALLFQNGADSGT
jgi:hypothetical protein